MRPARAVSRGGWQAVQRQLVARQVGGAVTSPVALPSHTSLTRFASHTARPRLQPLLHQHLHQEGAGRAGRPAAPQGSARAGHAVQAQRAAHMTAPCWRSLRRTTPEAPVWQASTGFESLPGHTSLSPLSHYAAERPPPAGCGALLCLLYHPLLFLHLCTSARCCVSQPMFALSSTALPQRHLPCHPPPPLGCCCLLSPPPVSSPHRSTLHRAATE